MKQEVLHALLSTGLKHGASDVHFRPGAPPMYRVNKQLVPLKADPLTPETTLAVCRVVGGRQWAKVNEEEVQEFDSSYSVPGVARFRVNCYRQRGSLALVLRIIPRTIPSIDELGLPPIVRQIAETERG